MNDLEHMQNKQISLKLTNQPKALGCTVKNAESSGLWLSGSPILQHVVQSGAVASASQLVVFVPYTSVDWFAMAEE